MTEKERLRLGVVRMSLVLVCMVLPLMMIWGFPKKSSSSEKELTPTPTESTGATPGPLGNVDTQMLWSLYAEVLPKDGVVKEYAGNSKRLFAARLEISAEEWEKSKAELTIREEWTFREKEESPIPTVMSSGMFSAEERDRLIEWCYRMHYVDLPEHHEVWEEIWAMQGEDEDTVLVFYLIEVY